MRILNMAEKPLWWGEVGTKETLETQCQLMTFKYAKTAFDKQTRKKESLYYANECMAFDIEDTSTYAEDEKISIMYVWQFGFNGVVYMGRTWEQFVELIDVIKQFTDRYHRVIVYIHYMDHEFAFMRRWFTWSTVFSRKQRSPIYAITGGVEFRDSYILTGKSLAKVAEDLVNYPEIEKKIGDLDYTKIRGTETPLTDTEIGYCMADVQILNAMVSEKIDEENDNIGRIPLTNTGYVRRFVRKMCMPTDTKHKQQNWDYFNYIHTMNMTASEYKLVNNAFAGGFTHANALYVDEYLTGRIDSIDFTSSYPAVMLSNVFPCTTGQLVHPSSQEELDNYLQHYLSIFTIKFKNIRQKKTVYESTISYSKCFIPNETKQERSGDLVVNNGRIVRCAELTTNMTNIDLDVVKQFYDYDCFYIGDMYIYAYDYLPKPIIEAVLELYKAKTELKGIDDAVVEYVRKKGMLNSIYGMMVTDIVKAIVNCSEEGEWLADTIPDLNEAISKYNENKRRFLFYPWGVFITSYARRNLFSGILSFGKDYVYSDTDSIKCLNMKDHMDYVKNYNKYIVAAIDKVLAHYNIPVEASRPKNKDGEEKQIGIWDWETEKYPYTEFKTLGAKRYMYTQYDKKTGTDMIHITIAGVSKKLGRDYIASREHPYDFFSDGMTIDKEHSGKLTHTYLDYEQKGMITDYLGNTMDYYEKSSVHLEKSEYKMSMLEDFANFIKGVRREQRNGG